MPCGHTSQAEQGYFVFLRDQRTEVARTWYAAESVPASLEQRCKGEAALLALSSLSGRLLFQAYSGNELPASPNAGASTLLCPSRCWLA